MFIKKQKKVFALILAAGCGHRAGKSRGPKQYKKIHGKPILFQTIEAFLSSKYITHVAVVIAPNDLNRFRYAMGAFSTLVQIISGGASRQESARLGLIALENSMPDIVLIHDGVRPFVEHSLIRKIVQAVSSDCGILPALPATDTIKKVDNSGFVLETISRSNLHAAQTPQAFPYSPILNAHKKAKETGKHDFTDDASVAEWGGIKMKIIPGSIQNQKITWYREIVMANKSLNNSAFFPDVRTGNGYDVHAFKPGDHIILCGVRIPYEKSLSGHSDADVPLHALTDALFATQGAQDIGTHFPPTDPLWGGAASSIFLEHAIKIVHQKKGRIANVDITLICESPRIAPYRDSMINNLMNCLRISKDRISIKATTNEKMGFIGRGEGIAAIATASVVYPGGLEQ